MKKKALVISDQPLTVLAMRSVLRQSDPDLLIEDATHLAEAVTSLANGGPFRLVVLDIDMAHSRRLSAAALLRKLWPQVPLAVLTARAGDTDAGHAIDGGVVGYLLKSSPTGALVTALRDMLKGEPALAPAEDDHAEAFSYLAIGGEYRHRMRAAAREGDNPSAS